jgi:hypothetical protein
MNDKLLRALINDEGVNGAVFALAYALQDYADEMSDLGLKEKAIEASDVAEMLEDIAVMAEE